MKFFKQWVPLLSVVFIKTIALAIVLMPLVLLGAKKNTTDGTACDLPTPQTMFLDRPQGLDSAAFFNPFYYDCCDEHATTWYWFAGYRYRSTWDGDRLAPCLFGNDQLVFAGSEAFDLNETELVADFVGMAPNTKTIVELHPKIQDHNFDVFARYDLCNLSDWFCNSWVAVGATLAVSKWNLDPHESMQTTDNQFNNFPACYMSGAAAGGAPNVATALGGHFTYGDMKTPLQYGKFSWESRTKTALANLDLFLGDDIIRQPKYHVGVFLKMSAPTGNEPNPEWIFNPVVGNGHHWEFGGGLDAHWTFWSKDEQCLQAYATGSITHLFNDHQWRSFDLKTTVGDDVCYSGAFSRYILLKEFDNAGNYNGNLTNAISFTTRKIDSSFGVQGDATFRLLYKNCGWAFGVGYNVFGRSAETIKGPYELADDVKGKHFGIKGLTGTCAREYVNGAFTGAAQTLNSTESQTRMFNLVDPDTHENVEEFTMVDNFKLLLDSQTGDQFVTWDSPNPPPSPLETTKYIARNSVPYVPVEDSDILFQGIPRLITHKVFAHLDYQWDTCCHCWQPFVGVGGELEFAQSNGCTRLCTPDQDCNASKCEPRFWSIWIRGGMNF